MCCECVSHHREKGEIPACFFPAEVEAETMSDRSIDNFIKSYQENKKKLEKARKD
jgi:hypothetical protein